MNDYDKFIELCEKNEFNFREHVAYDENSKPHPCIWLSTGHVEFDDNKMIKNIVCY